MAQAIGGAMATENSAVKCPSCGASVQLPEGRDKGCCAYCGTLVTAEKTNEKVVRHVDEAKLKHEEAKLKHEEAAAAVRLKELEMEEHRRELEERRRPKKTLAKVILVVVMLISFFVGDSSILSKEGSLGFGTGFNMVGLVCALILLMWMPSSSNSKKDNGQKSIDGSDGWDGDDWDDED